MSTGHRQPEPYAVLDSGATVDMIGGLGWKILRVTSQKELLTGAIDGMGSCVLPKVDGVTAVQDSRGETVLLGLGNVPWDRRQTQVESLWNTHHLRKKGAVLNDAAKVHGGSQNIILQAKRGGKDIIIPLDFDSDIITIPLREPTEEELQTLAVAWLCPSPKTPRANTIRRKRTRSPSLDRTVKFAPEVENSNNQQHELDKALMETSDMQKDDLNKRWSACLGYPNEKVLQATLSNTTQFYNEPIEMERRKFPR